MKYQVECYSMNQYPTAEVKLYQGITPGSLHIVSTYVMDVDPSIFSLRFPLCSGVINATL